MSRRELTKVFVQGIIVDTEEQLETVVKELLKPTKVVIPCSDGTERTYIVKAVRFKNKINKVRLSDEPDQLTQISYFGVLSHPCLA